MPWSQQLSVHLCLWIFDSSWTIGAQDDFALIYTFRELYISFSHIYLCCALPCFPTFCATLILFFILQFCSFCSMPGMPLPRLYETLSAQLKCHLLISLYCFTSHSVISYIFQKVKLHTFVLVYLLMSFSLTRMRAEGLSHLCFVHLGSQCLVCSWSPVNVSLTCSCVAVIHLLEVCRSFFLNNWNWTLCYAICIRVINSLFV